MAAWIATLGIAITVALWRISSAGQLNLSTKIEILGFLDGQGWVAVDGLLGIGEDDGLEQEITSSLQDPAGSSSSSSSRDSRIDRELKRSISSAACQSLPSDSIPCWIEDEDKSDRSSADGCIEIPCLVRPPRGYARPDPWPSCMQKARADNVNLTRSNTAIQVSGGKIRFQQSELDAAINYVDELFQFFQGSEPRLALNLEPGVGSLSIAFERHGVLALSIASKNSKVDAVQLVVERGFPGMVQRFGRKRLPYPSEAFDLIHFGRYTKSWIRKGGLLLFEADRILRAGGFLVWRNPSGNEKQWNDISRAAASMCWILIARKNMSAVWQKPANNSCYQQLQKPSTLCDPKSPSPDDAWGVPLHACLYGPSRLETSDKISWPARLLNSMRLKTGLPSNMKLATVEAYAADLNYWKMLTEFYLTSLGPSRIREIRNVLDANAGYGGFAAALASQPVPVSWWVLNVAPVDNPHNHLANIFDRGLLGVYHDWCKALPMHPRSFDLVHASRLFSAKHNCSAVVILLEIDRLLRPGGFAILRDDVGTLLEVKSIANALHWKTTIQDTDSGPQGKDKVMHCQKTLWFPQ